jgi:hypothetical protein
VVLFTLNSFYKDKLWTELIMWKYWSSYMKLCIEKTWTLSQWLDSPPWQCSSSSYWPKNQLLECSTHPVPLFGSEWLLVVSKNEVCFKGLKILKTSKKCDDTESYYTAGVPKMFPTVAASLVSRGVLRRWPLTSKLQAYGYACNKVIPGTS